MGGWVVSQIASIQQHNINFSIYMSVSSTAEHFSPVCVDPQYRNTLPDLKFKKFTHFKISDENFFNTSKTPIKRAFFWNQKIQKIMTPYWVFIQTFFSKFMFF